MVFESWNEWVFCVITFSFVVLGHNRHQCIYIYLYIIMRRDYAVGSAALEVFLLVRPCTKAAESQTQNWIFNELHRRFYSWQSISVWDQVYSVSELFVNILCVLPLYESPDSVTHSEKSLPCLPEIDLTQSRWHISFVTNGNKVEVKTLKV